MTCMSTAWVYNSRFWCLYQNIQTNGTTFFFVVVHVVSKCFDIPIIFFDKYVTLSHWCWWVFVTTFMTNCKRIKPVLLTSGSNGLFQIFIRFFLSVVGSMVNFSFEKIVLSNSSLTGFALSTINRSWLNKYIIAKDPQSWISVVVCGFSSIYT